MNAETTDHIFNQIYDRTYRKTAAYLTARCRALSDVEDLLQETYLAVYRVLSADAGQVFLCDEAYVISVAKSKLADYYRKNAPAWASTVPDGAEDWLAAVPDTGPTPEELAQYRADAEAVCALVAYKEEPVQRAFYLHYCFGLTFREIGALQGRSESTVRSGVFRLTKEIRGTLERSIL